MRYLLIFTLLFSFSSCRVFYPNVMFKTNKDFYYDFDKDEPVDYVFKSGDRLQILVFAEKGLKVIDLFQSSEPFNRIIIEFVVQSNGMVELPIVGWFSISGLSIVDAQEKLKELYKRYYVDPLILLEPTNRRVSVYIGSEHAQVVELNNENMTMLEILAISGGLREGTKAYKIKLIRGDLRNPTIKIFDLSTIEGMKSANLIVQTNDVIYVEPTQKISTGLFAELTPIVGILSSVATIILIVNSFGK